MAFRGLKLAVAMFSCVVAVCYGFDHTKLSELEQPITVSTSPSGNAALKAGVDSVTVSWAVSSNFTGDTSTFKKLALKLCYLKVSQVDRPWRKTEDELFKDKTCQHDVATKDFSATGSVTYKVLKDVPTAHYFVRAYVLDVSGKKIAYGQTNDVDLSVTGITGRHASLDIASAVFSAFSVISLAFFFYLEKKKSKRAT